MTIRFEGTLNRWGTTYTYYYDTAYINGYKFEKDSGTGIGPTEKLPSGYYSDTSYYGSTNNYDHPDKSGTWVKGTYIYFNRFCVDSNGSYDERKSPIYTTDEVYLPLDWITDILGERRCTLTVSATTGGLIKIGSGSWLSLDTKEVEGYDTIKNVECKAKPGYKFVSWSDGNTNQIRDILMDENKTLEALFKPWGGCALKISDTDWHLSMFYVKIDNSSSPWKLCLPYIKTKDGWKMCIGVKDET